MIFLELPFPPSLNGNWRSERGSVHRSTAYKAWIKDAGWELKRQKPGKISGKFIVRMLFGRPDKRKRDLDNLAKPVLDLLKSCKVIEDDSLTDTIIMRWIDGPGKVMVYLWPVDEVEWE